jgi:hypothetical protein
MDEAVITQEFILTGEEVNQAFGLFVARKLFPFYTGTVRVTSWISEDETKVRIEFTNDPANPV